MAHLEWTAGPCVLAYVSTLLALVALDAVWLGALAKPLYRREMGELMAASPRRTPAAIFYLAYPIAVVFFGLIPVAEGGTVAFARCAALGLVAYGTYDLTNMSVIRGFSIPLALVDMAWGTLATGLAGSAAFWMVTRGGPMLGVTGV